MPPNRLKEENAKRRVQSVEDYQQGLSEEYAKVREALGKLKGNKNFETFLEFEQKILKQVIGREIDEMNPNLCALLLTRKGISNFFMARDKAVQGILYGKKK